MKVFSRCLSFIELLLLRWFIYYFICEVCCSHSSKISVSDKLKVIGKKILNPPLSSSINVGPKSMKLAELQSFRKIAITTSLFTAFPSLVKAVQGNIKTSTLEEAKLAAKNIKMCLDRIKDMENASSKGDWQLIGDILSSDFYQNFENSAGIVVRSDILTAEDKVQLGTIKRYGVIADTIIMQGGLISELRNGGIKIIGNNNLNDIGDSDDITDEDTVSSYPEVNASEVKKYIKLLKDSLGDVCRIIQPLLV